MKKLNFKELELKSLGGTLVKVDQRHFIGEMIYANSGGLGYKLLAEKIYRSEGEIELTDAEIKEFSPFFEGETQMLSNKIADAIKAQLEKEDKTL